MNAEREELQGEINNLKESAAYTEDAEEKKEIYSEMATKLERTKELETQA